MCMVCSEAAAAAAAGAVLYPVWRVRLNRLIAALHHRFFSR